MASDPRLDICPNRHPIRRVGIRCSDPDCERFILFSPTVYLDHWGRLLGQGFLLVLATLAACVLFRVTGQIWPMYLFVAMGIMFLYAAVLTRGSALSHATIILTTIVLAWLGWILAPSVFHIQLARAADPDVVLLIAIIVWLLVTAYLYILGWSRTMSAVQVPGRYFLATGAFTLGFWGVWGIALDSDRASVPSFRSVLALGLALPAMCTVFLAGRTPTAGQRLPVRVSIRARGRRLNVYASWLLGGVVYLIGVEPLTRAVAFVLGQFLPNVLGRRWIDAARISDADVIAWRGSVILGLLLAAVALLAVNSAMQSLLRNVVAQPASLTFREMEDGPTEPLPAPRAMIVRRTLDFLDQPDPRASSTTSARQAAGQVLDTTAVTGTFLGEFGWSFLTNIWVAIRRVATVFVTVFAFTAGSMLIVLVLSELRMNPAHGPFFSAFSLWSMAMVVLFTAVVISGVAFEFAPSRMPIGAGRPLAELGTASLLAGLGYVLVSLVSVALLSTRWFPLGPSGTDLATLSLSQIYITNLVVVFAVLALLALFYATSSVRRLRSVPDRYLRAGATVVILVLAVTTISFGVAPIRSALEFASSRRDPIAEVQLRSLLPSSTGTTCTSDHLLLVGYVAGVSCRSTAGLDLSYHVFDSADHVNYWYAKTVDSRRIARDRGQCGRTATAEFAFHRATARGRAACDHDQSGVWIVWVDPDSRALAIASTAAAHAATLYESWWSGTIDLRGVGEVL